MSSYTPLSADGATWVWHRPDGDRLEKVSIRWDNEAWTVDATLDASEAEYVLRVSPRWQARQLLLFRDLDEPDLWLGTDGQGRWGEVNGAHRPDLDGATGVYVDDSVFGLAVQVARLPLEIGDRVEVPLAHIDTATLAVRPTRWWFERVATHRWVAEQSPDANAASGNVDREPAVALANAEGSAPTLPSRLEFDVDEHGMVVDVLDVARRRDFVD